MTREGTRRDPGLEAQLAKHLDGSPVGRVVYAYRLLDSTMEHAHALAAEGASEGTLLFAARQEKGRGRLGRTWESPEGGAYCSVILRPTRPLEEIPQLSLVAGLSCAQAIREMTGLFPSIRWPNDLLLNGQKVGGILVEAKNEAVVIGIGINVTTDPALLPDTATTLTQCQTRAAEKVSDTSEVVAAVCRRLSSWYDVWSRQGFAPIREALRPWMGFFGQSVHVAAGSEQLEGVATDVDEAGRLLVRLDSGLMRGFDVGEITLLR